MKKILFIFICLFSFPIISFADCDKTILGNYRKLATNVNVTYEITGTPEFVITMTNLHKNMIVYDGNKIYTSANFPNGVFSYKTTKSGRYNYTIYVKSCGEIGNKSITLPSYNAYYKDELCKGLENYSICQRWSGYTATRTKFESDIKKIKNQQNLDRKEEEPTTKLEKRWYEQITGIFVKYWWAIIILMLLIIGIYYTIRAKNKKNEFNFKV